MIVFFVGTCRVHEPVASLRRRGFAVETTPHRMHTPMQTLQLAEHVGGWREHYSTGTVHLLSDAAIEMVALGQRDAVWAGLSELSRRWTSADAFVVEISSLRESVIVRTGGSTLYANTFSARDLKRHAEALKALPLERSVEQVPEPRLVRLTEGDTVRAMQRIKRALRGKPVVWISHVRPAQDDPRLQTMIAVRSHVARTVKAGADKLGDPFFDPSEVAAQLGSARFFERAGDFDHLSQEAADVLGEKYWQLCGAALAAGPAAPLGRSGRPGS